MRIRTILAAAAAPLALGGVLLTTTAASASTGNGNGPGQSISAYYWQPNGHALSGPQDMPGGTVSLASGYLAKVTEKASNADIRGAKIEIKGTYTPSTLYTDQNGLYPPVGPNFRVFFEGGSAGTNPSSPDGYETQAWWVNGTNGDGTEDVDMNSANGTFDIVVHVDPSTTWNDWNGQLTTDPATATAFMAAASHVRQIGLSFGGGFYYENGVQGPAGSSLTVTSVQVNGQPLS
jgi:hypothetical protein